MSERERISLKGSGTAICWKAVIVEKTLKEK